MALHLAAVDMGHLHRPARELGRMQHDEAGPVSDDIGVGQSHGFESQRAVARSEDARLIGEALLRIGADGSIGNAEAVGSFLDPEVVDLRRIRAPILIADQEGDAAQDLDAGECDIAQLPTIEFHR